MKELICSKLFVINLLFLVGAPFLIFAENQQTEIQAQDEPSFVVLNSSSTNGHENDTGVASNDTPSEEKMQIQICDSSHPC
jgi:hypothetical protein